MVDERKSEVADQRFKAVGPPSTTGRRLSLLLRHLNERRLTATDAHSGQAALHHENLKSSQSDLTVEPLRYKAALLSYVCYYIGAVSRLAHIVHPDWSSPMSQPARVLEVADLRRLLSHAHVHR